MNEPSHHHVLFADRLTSVTSSLVASVAYAFAAVALLAPSVIGQSVGSAVRVQDDLVVAAGGTLSRTAAGTDVTAGDRDRVESASAWAQSVASRDGVLGLRVTVAGASTLPAGTSPRMEAGGVRRWTLTADQPVHGTIELRGTSIAQVDIAGGGASHRVDVGADGSMEFDSFTSATGSASVPVSFGPGDLVIDVDSAALIWGQGSVFGEVSLAFVLDTTSTAAVDVLGVGCAGANGRPTLAAGGATLPRIGTTFDLQAASLSRSGLSFVLFGSDSAQWNGLPLPLDLTDLGMFGCTLYHDIFLTVPVFVSPLGDATLPLAVPADPNLVGSGFFVSALSVDRAANPFGLILSNALRVQVGR